MESQFANQPTQSVLEEVTILRAVVTERDNQLAAKDAEIERLQEPTEEMTIAGGRSLRDSMNNANFAARARTCFKAMRGV